MLTILTHPNSLKYAPPEFNVIPWTDLPLMDSLPAGPIWLESATLFPEVEVPLLKDKRVLNHKVIGTSPAALLEKTGRSTNTLEFPCVMRWESLISCLQSPPLWSREDLDNLLVDWSLRSVPVAEVFTVAMQEDPEREFVSGTCLKVGKTLIPGPVERVSSWHGTTQRQEFTLPSGSSDWLKLPCDIAQISYFIQDGQTRAWRIEDGLMSFASFWSVPEPQKQMREILGKLPS